MGSVRLVSGQASEMYEADFALGSLTGLEVGNRLRIKNGSENKLMEIRRLVGCGIRRLGE